MNILNFFSRRNSAPVARERLQILLAHERGMVGGESDLVSLLREEIVALVRRHVNVERDNIQVKMNRGGDVSTLEIEVEIPSAIPEADCRTRLKSYEADRIIGCGRLHISNCAVSRIWNWCVALAGYAFLAVDNLPLPAP